MNKKIVFAALAIAAAIAIAIMARHGAALRRMRKMRFYKCKKCIPV